MSVRQPLLNRLIARFSKRNVRRPGRRRLFIESLEDRELMAYDLSVGPIVAEHSVKIELTSDSAPSSGTEIGQLLFSTQTSLSLSNFEQSEAFDGILYTVGSNFGKLSYIETVLQSGTSEIKVLPALLPGSNTGIIFDVEKVGADVTLVAQSQVNAQGSNAPTKYNILGVPTAVLLPPGGQHQDGEATSITPSGIIGGSSLSFESFVTTSSGSYVLPLNPSMGSSVVRSISDSGNYIGGGADAQMIAWKAIGNPEEGNYSLLNFTWELPQDAQGAFTMNIVVDHSTYGGLGMGSFLDVDGEKHEAIWSLSDGSLLKDFGAGSEVKDAKIVDGTTFISYNDATGAHVLNFESGKVYDLSTLLSTTQSLELTSGSMFETTANGKKALGFSYSTGGMLKASVFALATSKFDVSWDFDGIGTVDLSQNDVSLPVTTGNVFTSLGPTTIKAKVTDGSGNVTIVEKTVTVQNVALVTVNGKRNLLIGGDSTNDDVALEQLETGALKVTVNGASQEFAVVDEIFANLDGGANSFSVSGSLVMKSGNLSHLGNIVLSNGAALSNFTEVAALQLSTTGNGQFLTLTIPPNDGTTSSTAFSNEWEYGTLETINGVPTHTLVGPNGVSVVVVNGVYQNPLNYLDTNGNGNVSPIDALLVIDHLNQRSYENTPEIIWTINVNGDGRVSPVDALLVINFLNLRSNNGEGESVTTAFDDVFNECLGVNSWMSFDTINADLKARKIRRR